MLKISVIEVRINFRQYETYLCMLQLDFMSRKKYPEIGVKNVDEQYCRKYH